MHNKISLALMSGLFTVLFLSGCDDTPQEVSGSVAPLQAPTRNAQCYAPPKIPANIQYGSYPFWDDNSDESNIIDSQRILSEIEKNQDKNLDYYSLAIIIQTDKTTKMVSKETFTPQEAQLQVAELNSLIAAAQECYKAVPPSNTVSLIRYNFLFDSADQYSKVVAERIQRQEQNEPYNKSEKALVGGVTEWMVKGSAGRVIRAYNKVVSSFNELS